MNKFILILIICLLEIGTLYSQCCPYLDSIEIVPENPNSSDSIYLITNVTTPNVGIYLGYEIENGSNNEITVRACYYEYDAAAITKFTDTINLGTRELGEFTLNFTALMSIYNTECVPDDSTSTELSFEVKNVNSINVPDKIEIKCFPNPLTEQEMWISSSNQIEKVIIIDTYGKVMLIFDELDTALYKLDTKDLSVGTYLVKVIDKNNNWGIKKMVKLE